ncbi:hypothetical protein EYZ11_000757 [Aspergillus tanneri]|uniref:Uncharacterized protein n=1 Tax=Aspergillus tanneri TaxID=1220188 RepID=A0A4S3JWA7_9EURO|nr:uncharacterized protein ATNIH1004_004910 [Aspergillus tanneri]KAA8649019.1 hypothetical protein ATNIH1004_004910 [Aspergillus tanneri]THC99707.1 hypothetical protein EYZ11_000757 [Aspergillus tanneri]
MVAVRSTKQWSVVSKEKDFDGLVYGDAQVLKVDKNKVLVKFHGESLNYRDLIIPKSTLAALACPNYEQLMFVSATL